MELAKYNNDIVVLYETRLSEYGNLSELDYSIFWNGNPEGEIWEAGVGFPIKNDIASKLT